MAIIDQKLTSKTETTTVNDASFQHIVQGGTSYKATKSNFLKEIQAQVNATATGFIGSLAIATTPTVDGLYIAAESGTYTNAGGLVVNLVDYLTFITVSSNQTVFTKIEVSTTTLGYNIVTNLSTFDALITGSTAGSWLILSDFTLDANKTIPPGVSLIFNGGIINLSTFILTGTYTQIDAGLNQIFNSTNGTFAGTWKLKEVYPQWFGAVGDGVTDDYIGIQRSIDFVQQGMDGGNIVFSKNDFLIGTGIVCDNTYQNIRLVGSGAMGFLPSEGQTSIITSSAIVMFSFGSSSTTNFGGIGIDNIGFQDDGGTALGAVLYYRSNNVRIKNCSFKSFTVGYGLKFDGTGDACILEMIEGCNFRYNYRGITTAGLVTAMRVIGGYFSQNLATPIANSIAIDYGGDTLYANTSIDNHPTAIRLNSGTNSGINTVTGGRFEQNAIGVLIEDCGRALITNNIFFGDFATDIGVKVLDFINSQNYIVSHNIYVGTTGGNLIDQITATSITRANLDYGATGVVDLQRAVTGSYVHNLQHNRGAFGEDAIYRASCNSGTITAVLKTNFQSTATVQVGSETNNNVDLIRNDVQVGQLLSSGISTDGTWDGSHFLLGSNHLWADATGDLRIKASAPTSDLDGTVVGSQT